MGAIMDKQDNLMGQQQDSIATSVKGVPVDLIRVIAILCVLLIHATNDLTSQFMGFDFARWWIVDIYQCIGRMGVPLFLMLTGALLLTPAKKDENIKVFLKKRFSRIGLPFIFWGIICFIWTAYVENQPITQDFIVNGILKGPYFTFWYLFMLAGLYLITPLLRVMITHLSDKLYKYIICLWAIGIATAEIIKFASGGQYQLANTVFLIPMCTGYFIIGPYLAKVQIRRKILATLTILGLTLTSIATALMVIYFKDSNVYFFHDYFSPTVILAALPLFVLLNSYAKPQNTSQTKTTSWKQYIIRAISESTLSIYMLHMLVLYAIQNGLLGFTLTGNVINSIIGVPITATLMLILCLIIIIPLKKIPGLKKFVG
jgi:surface polysaccharide O-acyltransferase-like enzyme